MEAIKNSLDHKNYTCAVCYLMTKALESIFGSNIAITPYISLMLSHPYPTLLEGIQETTARIKHRIKCAVMREMDK